MSPLNNGAEKAAMDTTDGPSMTPERARRICRHGESVTVSELMRLGAQLDLAHALNERQARIIAGLRGRDSAERVRSFVARQNQTQYGVGMTWK